MEIYGFITSLITSFIVFLLLLALHSILSRRPTNAQIFYPAKIIQNISPPSNPKTFSWLYEAWSATEQDIIRLAGLDAAIYMTFLKSALSICICTSLFCIPVLIPISITDTNIELLNQQNATALVNSGFEKVAMGNVQDRSPRLWAYVIGAYWLSTATLYVLWKTYKHVVFLRTQDQSDSETARPEQYAILVRDIPVPPAAGSIAEEVDNYFRTLHPGTYVNSLIVTDASMASKLWGAVKGLDKKKLRIAHHGCGTPNLRGCWRALSLCCSETWGACGGTLGACCESPTDESLDQYDDNDESSTEKEGPENSKIPLQTRCAAIVFFNSRAAANSASQVMHSPHANQWSTCAAPEPREVVWENLPIPFMQRFARRTAVYFVVALTILFYMIPIAFVSAIISVDNLKKKLRFLARLVNISVVNAVLQAFLPQLVLLLFLNFLPTLLLKLSRMEGIPSQSHLDRAVAGKFFYFIVVNVFLGVTIAGSLLTSLEGIIDQLDSIVELLSNSLPGQATFFISFVALRFFSGYGLSFSRVVPLTVFNLKKKSGWIKSDEQIRKAWAPKSFSYATRVPEDMLILTITFCYAIIAPTILVFAITYFGLGWILMRTQALNVVVPKYESGGRMWPHIHSRILASLFLSQLTLLGYFGVKKFVYVPLLLPPLVATLVFAYICKKFFYPSFNVSSLSTTYKEPKNPPSIESIIEAYTTAYRQTKLQLYVERASRLNTDKHKEIVLEEGMV